MSTHFLNRNLCHMFQHQTWEVDWSFLIKDLHRCQIQVGRLIPPFERGNKHLFTNWNNSLWISSISPFPTYLAVRFSLFWVYLLTKYMASYFFPNSGHSRFTYVSKPSTGTFIISPRILACPLPWLFHSPTLWSSCKTEALFHHTWLGVSKETSAFTPGPPTSPSSSSFQTSSPQQGYLPHPSTLST